MSTDTLTFIAFAIAQIVLNFCNQKRIAEMQKTIQELKDQQQ